MTVPAAVSRRRTGARIQRAGLYGLAVAAAAFFLLPLYVMVVTSLKPMTEIQRGNLFALPVHWTTAPWQVAWSSACTGMSCAGIAGGFWNSVMIAVPSTVIPVLIGALNGYALALWKPRGAGVLFAVLMAGAFVPAQVLLYPMVRLMAAAQLFGTLPGIVIVHLVFAMPIMTLIFRQYFSALPPELFMAARVDGAGFWRTFRSVMLPVAKPMLVVAAIMQVTGVWNDYLFGLVFAGRDFLPMTVQLNNIINTTTGVRLYNVNMAATLLTSLVPLAVYVGAGRWFVRGVFAGSMKD